MGIKINSATWVTTNNILTTMSRLVSFLMFLSLMVMVVAKSYESIYDLPSMSYEYPHGCTDDENYVQDWDGTRWVNGRCEKSKREALDAPMTHKTKRAHPCVEECIQHFMEKR